MNRLNDELQRLYSLPEPAAGGDGTTRAMVLGFARAADWERVAAIYRNVQEELDLPAPAMSVSAKGGYRLWFSLAAPESVDSVRDFLSSLCRKYLADVPPALLECASAPDLAALPPAPDAVSGKWSAFIEPSLGSVFVDEPGLEMAPNSDRQADLLASLRSIRREDFQGALVHLAPPAKAVSDVEERVRPQSGSGSGLNQAGAFTDPKSFLLAVMNDPAACVEHRIEAAKALLPYFQDERQR